MALSDVRAPIHKNRRTTMERISGFYSSNHIFSNINLSSKMYTDSVGFERLQHFPILGPHGSWKNVTHEEIKAGPWFDVNLRQSFGPTWTTHWFHVTFVPVHQGFYGKEVHFRFECGTEAMVYDMDFNVLQGIGPGFRTEYLVTKSWNGTEPLEYYVEMACNGIFGAGKDNLIAPPDPDRNFELVNVDLAVFDRDNMNLIVDLEMLFGISEQLDNTHIGYQAMFVANEMVNLVKMGENAKARSIAEAFFAQGTGVKAHTLYAMGHCHIDSAWLWPYDETIRKCARSFSAQLGLMDEYPEYKFVVSSAQQYTWVKEFYPSLFAKIKERISEAGGKKFVPVGGTWVEMDGNMPSGESFMRQYYYGQKFFQDEFGILCKEFWLPDTFGYSAQIPQMLKHVGIERFLTQKMSWSLVNKFPNHNFWWEGIDGTSVLVHFPPGDGYNLHSNVNEVLRSQNNSTDKGRANVGAFLYGEGDGGGGPVRQEIERLKRLQNVDGMPRIVFSDSNAFFDELAKESHKFYRWVGELYLELHNGTYTSQARIKWFNRKCEFLFREVELLMAMAYSGRKVTEEILSNDMRDVDAAWKDFLLNQFHDVLPGSCIQFVAQDAWGIYGRVFTNMLQLRNTYHSRILGVVGDKLAVFNSLPWDARTVVFFKPDGTDPPQGVDIQNITLEGVPFENEGEGWYRVPSAFSAALVDLKASGYTEFVAEPPLVQVAYQAGALPLFGTFTNGLLTLEVRVVNGLPVETLLFEGASRTPAFNDYLNLGIDPGSFYIYDDIPMFWDAWDVMDYHLETRKVPDYSDISGLESFATGPIVGGYKWSAKFGNGSTITRYTILRAESPMLEYYTVVDWHESHKMLKVEWPVDVLSRDAIFEIQYGHASRPTHVNTSWDMAKFEVCGHKWMDISQADKGVTLITDSKYGWHVRDNHVSLSLLRSPKNPDANCDMHKHYIYYAALPHKGTFQESNVIQKAYELNILGSNNVSLLPNNLTTFPANFCTTSNKAVIVEAVKVSKAEPTRMNTLCIRLYESHGGYANKTEVTFDGFPVAEVYHSNGLEVQYDPVEVVGNKFTVDFKPFQIQSFLVKF